MQAPDATGTEKEEERAYCAKISSQARNSLAVELMSSFDSLLSLSRISVGPTQMNNGNVRKDRSEVLPEILTLGEGSEPSESSGCRAIISNLGRRNK